MSVRGIPPYLLLRSWSTTTGQGSGPGTVITLISWDPGFYNGLLDITEIDGSEVRFAGIVAPVLGTVLVVRSMIGGGGSLVFNHEYSGATAGQRFTCANGTSTRLLFGEAAILIYSPTTSRWIVSPAGALSDDETLHWMM